MPPILSCSGVLKNPAAPSTSEMLIFILVFLSGSVQFSLLHCFSSSVFLCLLFDVGNGGAFLGSVVFLLSLPLFTVWGWTWTWAYLSRWEQSLRLRREGHCPVCTAGGCCSMLQNDCLTFSNSGSQNTEEYQFNFSYMFHFLCILTII